MSAADIVDALKADQWKVIDDWIKSEQRESLNLDFKSVPASKTFADYKEITGKAMSAFANVEGGVLVFGLLTSQRGSGNPDALNSTGQTFIADADAFEQALRKNFGGLLSPKVAGVEIFTLKPVAANKDGVVVLYTPSSPAKPHRVADGVGGKVGGRYYMRTDTDSVPMPHEVLGALFGQVPAPRLRLVARWSDSNGGEIVLFLENVGRGVARNPIVRIDRIDGQLFDCTFSKPHTSREGACDYISPPTSDFAVFLPGFSVRLGKLSIRRTLQSTPRHFRLRGSVYADGSPPIPFDQTHTFAPDEELIFGDEP